MTKWSSYRAKSTKGILFEGLIKVSDFFFFLLSYNPLLKIAEKNLVQEHFTSLALIKCNCGAIQVIDSRVTRTWSHQTEVIVGYYRLLTPHCFFLPSLFVILSFSPLQNHPQAHISSQISAACYCINVYMTENGIFALQQNEFMITQGCNDVLIHSTR